MADRLQENDDDWGGVAVKPGPDPKKGLAKLKARAPVKRKKTRPFAMVYLDTAARAYTAMNCQKAMVWAWLVHRTWKRQNRTVTVPNGELAKFGVNPDAKARALRQLEVAGLIEIGRRPRKTPLVTLL
jgi:hypothetical protein